MTEETEGPQTTIIGQITNATPLAIAVRGRIYEADDPLDLGPVAGNTVLADYLPSSGQWIVVAIL